MNRLKFVVLSMLLLGLTACQSTHAVGNAAHGDRAHPSTSPAVNAKGRPGPGAQDAAADGALRLGDTADLYSAGSAGHLRITADAVVDPAVAVPAVAEPATGPRRVGIEVETVNVGGTVYGVAPGSFWAVDSAGVRHLPVHSGELTTGPPLALEAPAAGDTAVGWLVFEIPGTARPVSLHYRTTANYRSRTLVWGM
ncbi:hypothetical protein AB0M87_24770 [Streptomyces sp. NPDC051320]|uniref:hypothetical protein n=1 Tax=Streptomyces sp. NPDC051320 TaxID=3154644 RepID=UPI0034203C9D